MHTIVVGLNYKTAPVEVREKFSITEDALAEAMRALQNEKSILENVILSTCNRTEVYAVVDQTHTGRHYVKKFLADWFKIPMSEFENHLYIREDEQSVQHLFKVTSGIDSMVLGETQILGQIKNSFLEAQEIGTTGTMFNKLFKQSVTFAKKAHAETAIGENAVSVSYAAVELGKQIFTSLEHKHVAILGAGKMGELAMENLYGSGVGKVTVLNRTISKAEILAEKFHGTPKSIQELQCTLLEADILISSTGAKDYVIDYELMEFVEKLRKGKPLFMVDIAVPRDIDPKVGELSNVFLYDIDDLQGIVESNLAERERAAEQITSMIDTEIVEFNEWVGTLGVVPVIAALREKAARIQEETMASIENKMPDLTERERKVLSKHTKSIVNQLLKEPILQAKELAGSKEAAKQLQLFQEIFGIEEETSNQVEKHQLQAKERRQKASKKTNETQINLSF